MAVKKDRINRAYANGQGYVILPLSKVEGINRKGIGDEFTLDHVQEADIFPNVVKDPAEYGRDGDPATVLTRCGDVIFDPMADGAENTVFDPMEA